MALGQESLGRIRRTEEFWRYHASEHARVRVQESEALELCGLGPEVCAQVRSSLTLKLKKRLQNFDPGAPSLTIAMLAARRIRDMARAGLRALRGVASCANFRFRPPA